MENLTQTEQVQSLEQAEQTESPAPEVVKVDFMNHFNFKPAVAVSETTNETTSETTNAVVEPAVEALVPIEPPVVKASEVDKADAKMDLENSYMADVRLNKILSELQQASDSTAVKINNLNQQIKENNIKIQAIQALLN